MQDKETTDKDAFIRQVPPDCRLVKIQQQTWDNRSQHQLSAEAFTPLFYWLKKKKIPEAVKRTVND